MIFSRNRAGSGRHAARRRDDDDFEPPEIDFDDDDADESDDADVHGPYDIGTEPDDVERLDLGSLKVPVPRGVELRVQADPDGQIQQVLLISGASALQLGVFAAPRTEGVWDEVRADIRKQLFNDGVAAEESAGPYGPELRARVRTPDGLTDIRFVGIDGPRWMVRAVYQGPAATDAEAALPLDAVVHGLVVDRGAEAMPVRDPLPLRLPREVAEGDTGSDGQPSVQVTAAAEVVEERPRPSPSGRSGGSRRRPSPKPRRG